MEIGLEAAAKLGLDLSKKVDKTEAAVRKEQRDESKELDVRGALRHACGCTALTGVRVSAHRAPRRSSSLRWLP